MSSNHRWLVLVLVLCASSMGAHAREWVKYHETILDESDSRVSEYTHIATSDSVRPFISRTLFRGPSGENVVIRNHVETDGSGVVSVELQSSGEVLEFSIASDETVTVALGGESFSYHGDDEGTAAVIQQGQDLLSNGSPDFQDAVLEVAVQGGKYVGILANVGQLLAGSMFDNVVVVGGTSGSSTGFTGVIEQFDPNQHPPTGAFDQSFGQAYFQ